MIIGYHHCAFKAASAEQLWQAVAFYKEQFGLDEWGRYGTEESPKVFLTDHKQGNFEFSVFEGYEPVEGVIRHIAIQTDDNEADCKRLADAGCTVLEWTTPVKHLWPGHDVIMAVLKGPLGETIELVQEV